MEKITIQSGIIIEYEPTIMIVFKVEVNRPYKIKIESKIKLNYSYGYTTTQPKIGDSVMNNIYNPNIGPIFKLEFNAIRDGFFCIAMRNEIVNFNIEKYA